MCGCGARLLAGREARHTLPSLYYCNTLSGTSRAGAATALWVFCRFISWEMPEIVLGTHPQSTPFTSNKTPTSFGRPRQISRRGRFAFPLAEPTKLCSRTAKASRAFNAAMMAVWCSLAVLIALQWSRGRSKLRTKHLCIFLLMMQR